MAIAQLPIDFSAFSKVMFFSAEPAMVWDSEKRESTDEQKANEDGLPLYVVRLVVEYQPPRGRLVSEVIEVETVDEHGEDPAQTCAGKSVALKGLSVANYARAFGNGASLSQRFTAESIAPVETGTRKRTNGTATDTASALLDQGAK